MFEKIVGGIGLLAIVIIVMVVPNGTANPDTRMDYIMGKGYLSKNNKDYARCTNSIKYGSSTIGHVRLQIIDENFYDESITSERLNGIEESFMETVKDRCQSKIQDYESAYQKANQNLEEIKEAETSWWTLIAGSPGRELTADDLTEYSPDNASIKVGFGDYVFTEQEAKQYFEAQLGL